MQSTLLHAPRPAPRHEHFAKILPNSHPRFRFAEQSCQVLAHRSQPHLRGEGTSSVAEDVLIISPWDPFISRSVF